MDEFSTTGSPQRLRNDATMLGPDAAEHYGDGFGTKWSRCRPIAVKRLTMYTDAGEEGARKVLKVCFSSTTIFLRLSASPAFSRHHLLYRFLVCFLPHLAPINISRLQPYFQ